MPIAIWSPQYETGHVTVDEQHRRLFQMVNDLHHAIISGHGPEKVGPILKGLASYTVEHFRTEELMMATTGYPGLARHKEAHTALVKAVKELLGKFDVGETVLPSTLSRFLTDWLNHHIKEEDKALIGWVKSKE